MKPIGLCLLLVSGCLGSAAVSEPGDGVPVGVLLPYTGELGAVGQNLERAVIMANEKLADSEPGANQPPFHLVFRDTRSKEQPGLAAAQDLIANNNVSFILGPEEPLVAQRMAPMLGPNTVAITGGAVSLDPPPGGSASWFRIVPTAKRLSGALADQMIADAVNKLAIIFVPDPYGIGFAQLAAQEFTSRNGTVVAMAMLDQSATHGDLIRTVTAAKPDAILLVAYPTVGAAVVQEWAVLGSNERWYFGPSLRSEVFAQNVPPNLLENAVGISAGLAADARNFDRAFEERWRDEVPSPNAHYYYDAMLLAGMAYRSASLASGGKRPSAEQLHKALVDISGPGGTIRTWQDVAAALRNIEAGQDIDFRVTTGPINFSDDGSVPIGFVQKWTIVKSAIETL
jgi:ABC-type branched-subunit amino acid transport system substrate-binding protein